MERRVDGADAERLEAGCCFGQEAVVPAAAGAPASLVGVDAVSAVAVGVAELLA